jgi:hypothetical protein
MESMNFGWMVLNKNPKKYLIIYYSIMSFITKYKYVIDPVEYEYLLEKCKDVHSVKCHWCDTKFLYDEFYEYEPIYEDCKKYKCKTCVDEFDIIWNEKYKDSDNISDERCIDTKMILIYNTLLYIIR